MKKKGEERPDFGAIETSAELRRWYWLKDELIAQARVVGVKTTGGKFTILDRLAHYLDTGETVWPGDKKVKVTSTFDWGKEVLSAETIITDSYKNSQNVRRFFQENADPKFKFNIAFMEWIKANHGKTLGDAIAAYEQQKAESSDPNYQTNIKSHNQFNQYTRDFLADNPSLGMADVRRIWQLKRALPTDTGRHIYDPSDLDLT